MQVRQFLVACDPDNLEKSPAVALEEMARINVLSDYLEGDVGWDLVNMMGRPNLASQASFRDEYGRLRKVCLAVSESVLS